MKNERDSSILSSFLSNAKEKRLKNTKRMAKRFEIVDGIKSDIMFKAYGRDLSELFKNSALALSSLMCRLSMVPKKQSYHFSFKGSIEHILYDFLSKILYICDSEEVFLSDFEVVVKPNVEISSSEASSHMKTQTLFFPDTSSNYSLSASCWGSLATSKAAKMSIKAITMHKLKISVEQQDNGAVLSAQVVVDV